MRCLHKDRKGATAVEFALIAPVFIFMTFAILEVCLVFGASLMLEQGAMDTARKIRTGEMHRVGATENDFRRELCNNLVALIDCNGELYIDVRTFRDFGAAIGPNPDGGAGGFGDDFTYNMGGANSVVMVRVYYFHKMTTPLIGKIFANRPGNKRLISWTVAFENEPF